GMSDLVGKVALVTGASRGIGRAIARALANAGCDVAINYREREEQAKETLRLVEAQGRKAILAQADVSKPDEVERLVARVARELGAVDVLVNNAGQSRPMPLEALSVVDFDTALAVNLRSAFLVSQAVLPSMRAKGWGRLVYLSSVAAQ